VFSEIGLGMRNRKKVVFLSADHLDQQADARVSDAKHCPKETQDRVHFATQHS